MSWPVSMAWGRSMHACRLVDCLPGDVQGWLVHWSGAAILLPVQVAKVREQAERHIAQLNSRLQGLESRVHQLTTENAALSGLISSGLQV